MTYNEYVVMQMKKRIQPLSKEAFEAMIKAGFNFEVGRFN